MYVPPSPRISPGDQADLYTTVTALAQWSTLADLGGVPGACPQGSRFFRLDIKNFQNVTTSESTPNLQGRRPPREILDPPLE